MDTLIQGLVERTAGLLPFCKTEGATKLGDLKQNASSLIKLSKHKLDVVIEGLLHLYSSLLKTYNTQLQNELATKSQEEKDIAYEKFIRSKIIVFQLFFKTLSAAINNNKLDLRFEDDFMTFNDELYNKEEEDSKIESEIEKSFQEQKKQESIGNEGSPSLGTSNSSANNLLSSSFSGLKDLEKEGGDNASTPSGDSSSAVDGQVLDSGEEKALPQLEQNLAQSLLKYIIELLFPTKASSSNQPQQQQNQKIPVTLRNLAARVLFKLSVVSFDVVFSKIEQYFKNMKADDVDESIYRMIEYINFDSWKLSRLISLLNDSNVQSKFKKNAFVNIANPLRLAIWNWVINYPHQFIKICKNKSSLPGNPMLLFENMSSFASKNDKKQRQSQVWPVQTMLLLLCPEILSSVIMAVKQGIKNDARKKQRKFIENLIKALRDPKDRALSDAAVLCLVDLYKASTFLSKSDLTALRFLVSDVQNDLQERLMNADTTVKTSEGKPDTSLIVDFLVAAYRLNPRHVTSYIFTHCFTKGTSLYKLVLTKAMFKLAQEGQSLPWHPTLAASYSFLAKNVRQLFKEVLTEERNLLQQMKTQGNSSSKKPVENYCTETLINLLAVFYTDPRLILENTSQTAQQHINELIYFCQGLCSCLSDSTNAQIQNQAYRLMQKLFNLKYIELWCTQDIASGFIEISSYMISQVCMMLHNDKDFQGPNIKALLDLLKEMTSSCNKFLHLYKDSITAENAKSRKRIVALESIETELLILLCSPDNEVWTTAAACFGDLCDQVMILGDKEPKNNSIFTSYALYRRISRLEELGKQPSAQNKAIRKMLRKLDLQTKPNMAAFIEVNARWKTHTTNLIAACMRSKESKDDSKDASLTKMKVYWKHYTSFLCSIAGVCMQAGEAVFASTSGVNKKDHSNTVVGNKAAATTPKAPGDETGETPAAAPAQTKLAKKDNDLLKYQLIINTLVEDLMKLAVSDIAYIKDTSAAVIGKELSPSIYGVLFHHMHQRVASMFGEEGSVLVTDQASQFVEQSIKIVQEIIEDAQENSDGLTLANFETLVSSFVTYCSSLLMNSSSLKIKAILCKFIDTMLSRKEYITFLNEVQFKYQALLKIVEWTSYFAQSRTSVTNENNDDAKNNTYYKDLDPICMKAIASLLKDLPLSKLKMGDKNSTAKEKEDLKKTEFFKYFDFLSRYLTKSSKNDKTTSPQLRENTIAALGNLLESNINYGLEKFMNMAYIEDQETRSAFLGVLTKIVSMGINFENEEQPQEKYFKLIKFLTSNIQTIFSLVSVLSVAEQDTFCRNIVYMYEEQKQVLKLLKVAIEKEVDATASPGTLFRANTPSSKMLSAYCNMVGKDYLINMLGALVNELIKNPSQFEVDPLKAKANDDIPKNIENLKRTAQAFVERLLDSFDEMPVKMKIIAKYLSEKVYAKFPTTISAEETAAGYSSKYVSIGGFIVLRFMNPAIISPHNYGLTETAPSSEAVRSLLLVTKIIQNLANGVKFTGKKEEYMLPFDSFITTYVPQLVSFFDKIIAVDEKNEEELSSWKTDEELRDSKLVQIHRILFENQEKIVQKLQQDNLAGDQLAAIVSELGEPPLEEKHLELEVVGKEFTNSKFTDFVNRIEYSMKNTDVLKSIEALEVFYRKGESKEGRPVVYFSGRKFGKIEGEDIQYLIYHVLVTLRSVFASKYEIVFDCTGLKEKHDLKYPIFKTVFSMLPYGAKKNCARIIILNANTTFKNNVKQLAKHLSRKMLKKIEFCAGVKELTKFIEEKNIYVQAYTTDFEKDVQSVYSGNLVNTNGSLKECVIKLSNRKLCVIIKKENFFGLDTKRVEFINLAEINGIRIEKHPSSNNNMDQVVISYEEPAKVICLKTDMNEQLVLAIRTCMTRNLAKKKLQEDISKVESNNEGGIRQSDIPGTMLNMCFLNLEAKFPRTRSAAYNLLAALAEQFDFPVALLESQNMSVPHNTGDLVVALSTQVAQARPALTTQFLKEGLRGFNKISLPYKYLCLSYMKPWIKNLSTVYTNASKEEDLQTVTKIKEWVVDLTKSTILPENVDIYPALLSEVWGQVSKEPELVQISMECIMKESAESGLSNRTKLDVLNDLIVTLASSSCAELVVKTLVEAILVIFDSEIKDEKLPLESNPPWAKLTVYCRFLLMLSFQNRIKVVNNLPVLFHIITLMVARGSILIRATIHALVFNIVHSLATVLPCSAEQKKQMKAHLTQLTNENFCKIFMGCEKVTMDPFIDQATSDKESLRIQPLTMQEMETIPNFLLDVMRTCYKVDPHLETIWHGTWVQYTKADAEKMNPILLPRLLCTFGILMQPSDCVDSFPFLLHCMICSFTNYTPYRLDLPVSALLFLQQFCYKVSHDSPLLKKFIFIPCILLSICDPGLFPVVVQIFRTILLTVSNSKHFKECNSLEHFFNQNLREGNTEAIVSKFEKLIGISFKTNFSFAMACLLMKGLTHTGTKDFTNQGIKDYTCQLLTTLITVSQSLNTNITDILGFITALIPNQWNNLSSLLGEGFLLFTEENFAQAHTNVLFVRYLLTVVHNVELDTDKVVIYEVLLQALQKLPKIFEPVYSEIMPRVIKVYSQATSSKIAEVSLALINNMMVGEQAFATHPEKDIMKEISFHGISRASAFKNQTDKLKQESVSLLLEFLKGFGESVSEVKSSKKYQTIKQLVISGTEESQQQSNEDKTDE